MTGQSNNSITINNQFIFDMKPRSFARNNYNFTNQDKTRISDYIFGTNIPGNDKKEC